MDVELVLLLEVGLMPVFVEIGSAKRIFVACADNLNREECRFRVYSVEPIFKYGQKIYAIKHRVD